jgi:hypothetical protein
MTDQRRDLLKIRVELIGISPPVWREVLVPARYSFWDLHVAIQDAMGWLDYHLHEFRFGGASRDDALLVGIPSDEMWDDSLEVQPGWDIPVIDFLSTAGLLPGSVLLCCAFRCNLQRASPIKVKLNQSLGKWLSDF